MVLNSTKTLTSSPLLSTVLHACDIGINMDGREHGPGKRFLKQARGPPQLPPLLGCPSPTDIAGVLNIQVTFASRHPTLRA